MVVEPVLRLVARPLEPAELLMVATPVSEELQATVAVRSCLLSSEKIPVAASCRVVPRAMLGAVGVTLMETSVAGVTVTAEFAEMLPEAAVMVVVPVVTPWTIPLEPAVLLTVATAGVAELQVTEVVRSCRVASEKMPVATNCRFVPTARLRFAGVISRLVRVALPAPALPPRRPHRRCPLLRILPAVPAKTIPR